MPPHGGVSILLSWKCGDILLQSLKTLTHSLSYSFSQFNKSYLYGKYISMFFLFSLIPYLCILVSRSFSSWLWGVRSPKLGWRFSSYFQEVFTYDFLVLSCSSCCSWCARLNDTKTAAATAMNAATWCHLPGRARLLKQCEFMRCSIEACPLDAAWSHKYTVK